MCPIEESLIEGNKIGTPRKFFRSWRASITNVEPKDWTTFQHYSKYWRSKKIEEYWILINIVQRRSNLEDGATIRTTRRAWRDKKYVNSSKIMENLWWG